MGQSADPSTGLYHSSSQTLVQGTVKPTLGQNYDSSGNIGGDAIVQLNSGGTVSTQGVNQLGSYTHKGMKQITFKWKTTHCTAAAPCGPYADYKDLFSYVYPSFALKGGRPASPPSWRPPWAALSSW